MTKELNIYERFRQFLSLKADIIAEVYEKDYLTFRIKPDGYLYVEEVRVYSDAGIVWTKDEGLQLDANKSVQNIIRAAYTHWVNAKIHFDPEVFEGEEYE